MTQRLWIVATVILSAAPIWAQPDDQGATVTRTDDITAAELERKIGGRTTLELKFKDLTTEQVTAVVAKSSGLPVVAPPQSPFNRVMMGNPNVAATSHPEAAPTWNGDVAQMEFWLALRTWGRAENVRLKRELEAVKERQKNEARPDYPQPAAGETTVAPEIMAEWQKTMSAWSQRQMSELNRFNPNGTLSANFDANAKTWSLVPNTELLVGRAVNIWPCMVLATRFRRDQNFSIREDEPEKNALNADENKTKPAEAKPAEAKPATDIVVNEQGQEVVSGGFLNDSLSLNLSVYLEPKLLDKAKVQIRVDEARDDADQDLLIKDELGVRGGSHVMNSVYYGSNDSGIANQVQLRPRQAKGQKLAVLRGVVVIRYPMQLQEHEITNLDTSQTFSVNTEDVPVEAQFVPPHLSGGYLRFSTSLKLESNRGGRKLMAEGYRRMMAERRQFNTVMGRSVQGGSMRDNILDSHETPLGHYLLPSRYTLIDTQGRTWIGMSGGGGMSLMYPDGRPVPVTSPPTPPPDNFTYSEESINTLQLPAPNPRYPGEAVILSPEELAKVRFTKATFITESNWRTLEVPFEFHDLPLPPR